MLWFPYILLFFAACSFVMLSAMTTRAFQFSRITCFAAYGGEVEREVARAPRAPAGGLAALLHHLPFQHHGKTEKPCYFSFFSMSKKNSIKCREQIGMLLH